MFDKKLNFDLIVFAPYYHAGGAERVLADLVGSLSAKRVLSVFTDRSRDDRFLKKISQNAKIIKLYGLENKIKFIKKLLIALGSRWINRNQHLILLGTNSRFYYDLLPHIDKHIRKIDIVHWLDGEAGQKAIIASPYVDRRVIVTPALRGILAGVYRRNHWPREYASRIETIENQVLKTKTFKKDWQGPLKVLYIGRNSSEKRIELLSRVQAEFAQDSNVEWTIIGRGLKDIFVTSCS